MLTVLFLGLVRLATSSVQPFRLAGTEVVHYSMSHKSCESGAFREEVTSNPARLLFTRNDRGASCESGHVGVVLNSSCCCVSGVPGLGCSQYLPLQSNPAEPESKFGQGMNGGLTIELWLRPAAQRTPSRKSVILALNSGTLPEGAPTCEFENAVGDEFTLALSAEGCLHLMLRTPGGCVSLPSPITAVPHYCKTSHYLGINRTTYDIKRPRLTHVVVSVGKHLKAQMPDEPSRLAMYATPGVSLTVTRDS